MNDDLREEYQFDYRRQAATVSPQSSKRRATGVLDPEVAAAFPDPKSVNDALKAYLQSKPRKPANR